MVKADKAVLAKLPAALMHERVHLRQRLDMAGQTTVANANSRLPFYLFAHMALPEFVFGNPHAVFMLLDEKICRSTLRSVVNVLEEELRERGFQENIDLQDTDVTQWMLESGPCILVQFPEPKISPEAYFAAIVTNLGTEMSIEKLRKEPPHYLTLEMTDTVGRPLATIIGEWTVTGKRNNFGIGPNPRVQDFLMYVERAGQVRPFLK